MWMPSRAHTTSRMRRTTLAKVVAFPPASDAAQREQALDIHASWIVEAPAGSGKTGLLIQRYLKLLADDSVTQPEQVLAITFTLKATAELRDRVIKALEEARRQSPFDEESDFAQTTRALATGVLARSETLGWDLLSQPQRMNVRTIDSVCAEIAGMLPLLSGSGGARTPVEAPMAFYREAARRTLMQLGGSDAALHAALNTLFLHRDGNLGNCERLIASMLQGRDQWGELVPLGHEELSDDSLENEVRPKLERALKHAIYAKLTRVTQRMPQPLLKELTAFAAELAHAPGYNGADSPIALCAELHNAPGETAEYLDHWRALIHLLVAPSMSAWRSGSPSGLNKRTAGFEITTADRARLSAIIDALRGRDDLLQALFEVASLPPAKYPDEQWVVAKALFRILRQAMVELKLLFAEREECDFTEMALAAKEALSHVDGAADYADAMGMKLQHLLVDEMQDTSLSQYELIELLTRGWDGHGQTIFLVGDPKQSIYLFRYARVERFLRTMEDERLGDLPLGSLRLTANFRSQKDLVQQFNDDFSGIFPRDAATASTGDVPFVEAVAIRDASDAEGLMWHAHVVEEPRLQDNFKNKSPTPTMRQAMKDAQEIRRIVEKWRAKPLPPDRHDPDPKKERPWKIAVLVRTRSHLAKIVPALKQADEFGHSIPFRAVEIEPLRERQEVLDVFALTRALLHPADRTAWFAVLHAPWCGLGLADLHRLAGADDPEWEKRDMETVIAERAELLSVEGCQRVERIWSILQTAMVQRGRMTIAQWVERTWRSLGGDAYATPDELANVQHYLRLLDEVEPESAFYDPALLQQNMESLFAESSATADAVDLMTIHKAKGLEWDVVIVPSLEKKARNNPNQLLSWLELDSPGEAAAHVLLAPIVGTGEDSDALNRWINSVQKARDAAERKRLYYVACTRAREALHLFAAPKRNKRGDVSVPADSLLSAAWPVAEQHFPAAGNAFLSMSEQGEDDDLALAAAGEEPALELEAPPPLIRRLPLAFDPQARFRQSAAQHIRYAARGSVDAETAFERPEGSFAARTFGNAVHAFMEVLAEHLARGSTPTELLNELPTWDARIAALVRSSGLPPAMTKRLTQQVRDAMEKTLHDPTGRWLLAPHAAAHSEQSLDLLYDHEKNVRLDRIFVAGAQPLAEGEECLWIIDFKTGDPGKRSMEQFFEAEKEKYRPQMETYAKALQLDEQQPIRLALYYPLVPRLIWWAYS